jgi:hypothetical protein
MMILVKKHLPILEHMHFEEPNVEVLVARVIVKGLHIAIINIYATPSAILASIVNAIVKALCNLHCNEIIVVLGDFNIDMCQCNEKTKKLQSYMYNQNLHFLLDQRKHVQRTLIDHVWSNVKNELSIFFFSY